MHQQNQFHFISLTLYIHHKLNPQFTTNLAIHTHTRNDYLNPFYCYNRYPFLHLPWPAAPCEVVGAAASGAEAVAVDRESAASGAEAAPVDGGTGSGVRAADAPEDGVGARGGGGLRRRGGAVPEGARRQLL